MITQWETLTIRSNSREDMIDMTNELQQLVKQSGVQEGLLALQVMHTTAGITVNENADPDVVSDMLTYLKKLVPKDSGFRHGEGNSDAHIKSALIGPSLTLLVSQGRLVLGTWQGVYFCEFDGPRQRQVAIRILE